MKQSLLMPHACKIAGWILLIPSVVLWLWATLRPDGRVNEFLYGGFLDAFLIIISGSMLLVAFSRERDEDEYVAAVRSKYLMLAFYIDFIFIVVTTFAVNSFGYLNIMAVQMFLILFLHIVMFNTAMAVIRKRRSHEE